MKREHWNLDRKRQEKGEEKPNLNIGGKSKVVIGQDIEGVNPRSLVVP